MLEISVIGYKNHAEKVANFLCELLRVEIVNIYHPNSKKILDLISKSQIKKKKYTSDWKDLLNSDAFFICSPSETHADYILKILNTSNPVSYTHLTLPTIYSV